MWANRNIPRREFVKDVAIAGALACVSGGSVLRAAAADGDKSQIFRVDECPIHDGQTRHVGIDALLRLLADNGIPFYRTSTPHLWGGPTGIIDRSDVVVIKVNCQWKCRGTTNTDVLRGLIQRILEHPDGFNGEVVIMENGQGRGGFNGFIPGGSYDPWPDIKNNVHVNAEEETILTVEYLVNTVFAGLPVSSFLLDSIRGTFISGTEHSTNGYRKIDPPPGSTSPASVSYPCYTSTHGNRIELREGVWTGSSHSDNLRLINVPVLKHHGGTGMTGVLKHVYGILSMSDGNSGIRHYVQAGSQCGKMWSLVRIPDLNVLDCIWVSHESLEGYPVSTTRRTNVLLAGLDPTAMDYYASKHVLLPLGGGIAGEHNPDTFSGLIGLLSGAQDFINTNGGIAGIPARTGDENIEVIARPAVLGVPHFLLY